MRNIPSLNEYFEYVGKWWLPATPERKIFGTFKYMPDKGLNLIREWFKEFHCRLPNYY